MAQDLSQEGVVDRLTAMLGQAVAWPSRKAFAALHAELNSLEYLLLTDRSAVSVKPHPAAERAVCSADGCEATWRTSDACLLNVAPDGQPRDWRCREHHPVVELGGHRPAGYQPPVKTAA